MVSCLCLAWVSIVSFVPHETQAYFEARYFCVVRNTQITVSLQKTNKLCLDYIRETEQRLDEVNKNIIAAQNHIRLKQDVVYRQWVLTWLQWERTSIQVLKEKLVVAIDDFEWDLFRKIHALVRYQLKGDREKVFARREDAMSQARKSKSSGDVHWFVRATQRVEYYQKRVHLLDRIHFAQSFEEMMPFLKEYLGAEKLQLSVPKTDVVGTGVTSNTGSVVTPS